MNRLLPVKLALIVILGVDFASHPQATVAEERTSVVMTTHMSRKLVWEDIEPGFSKLRYPVPVDDYQMISPEVLVLRFSPKRFLFRVVTAADVSANRTFVKNLTVQSEAIVGINANFFDPEGRPLGLVISGNKKLQELHRGGNLLTGVFAVRNQQPMVEHRADFKAMNVVEAFQAGPRLIIDGKATELSTPRSLSRRSGVAITTQGDVLLYVTTLRFPGVSLRQIQTMLLRPELSVADALNLDGGGSSQLYISPRGQDAELHVSGGDEIPVALVVKRRVTAEPKR